MKFQSKSIRKQKFTLLELVIVIGILAIFLFLCSNTLIFTLQTKKLLGDQYSENRVKSIGWNILYLDLANAVGKYYLEGTVPIPPPPKLKKGEKPPKPKAKPNKNVPKLLVFNSDFVADEPFLEVVVSRGRVRRTTNSDGIVHSFRLVKYYIIDHPDDEGQLLLRTEQAWDDGKAKEGEGFDDDEDFDLEQDYRRFTVLENYTDFEVRVYNGKEWVEEWNSTSNGDLPLALKIKFNKIGDEEDQEEAYFIDENDESDNMRVIPIPLSYLPILEPEEGI